jgi:hypothetical protein
VEQRIFDEIRTCTYKNVGGFDAKYFEGKGWEEQLSAIYRRILEWDGYGLAGFPDPQDQDDVLEWWLRFQTNFLRETRGLYFTTADKLDLKGSDAERQLNFLMKARAKDSPGHTHNWKDVRVVGEHKRSNTEKKGTLLQME